MSKQTKSKRVINRRGPNLPGHVLPETWPLVGAEKHVTKWQAHIAIGGSYGVLCARIRDGKIPAHRLPGKPNVAVLTEADFTSPKVCGADGRRRFALALKASIRPACAWKNAVKGA